MRISKTAETNHKEWVERVDHFAFDEVLSYGNLDTQLD